MKIIDKWIIRLCTPEYFKMKIKEQEDIANQANRAYKESEKYYKKLFKKLEKCKNGEEIKEIIKKEMIN